MPPVPFTRTRTLRTASAGLLHIPALLAGVALAVLSAHGAPAFPLAPHRVAPDTGPRPVGKPQVGKASYYGTKLAGQTTADGSTLKPRALTAASRTLPLGSKARVTNLENGKSVHVTVNDRGPAAKSRIIDVTPKAAEQLGMKHDGLADVKVQPLRSPKG